MPVRALLSELQLRFNAEEMAQLAATHLGLSAGTIWPARATTSEAALALMGWAERHRRLCDLATAAAQERPGNEALQMIARLMPLWCASEGRQEWDPLPEDVERRSSVPDPGDYSNGVQRTLGRVETQIDALRTDVAEVRQELAAQREASEKQRLERREEMEKQRAELRTLLWLVLVLMGGVIGTAGAVAAHAWGG